MDISDDKDRYVTPSGIPLDAFYPPNEHLDYNSALGNPGQFPYTRGNFATGYRERLWTFRQYAGFGTAEESNERYKYLLGQGATGLSVALDLPTQCGYDSSDVEAEGEVGRVGVAIDSVRDMEILFNDIPLDEVSVSFTINGTAAIILAFYIVAAEKQAAEIGRLRGTIQNDILKEYASRGTWIWPPKPSLRLTADTIEYCADNLPLFNAISVAGAHFRDAGANAIQEMAFTLSDAVAYCEELTSRGRMKIDDFAPQLSFFFYTHGDFFEEIAKYRAGRRIWARIARERFGATNDKSCMLRAGCVCGGASLYSRQPMNNLIRVAYENMASVLGGVQSIFTAAWDEPFALPTQESTTLALRTQQILAYETGVAKVVDPLGGSYFIEELTDGMEERIVEVMNGIERYGGMVKAIEQGYIQQLISQEAYRFQQQLEAGKRQVVGVNIFTTDDPTPDIRGYAMDERNASIQLERLANVKSNRDSAKVHRCLDDLAKASGQNINLMPLLLECARAYCTVGEITSVLKEIWGEYAQPVVF